MGIPLDITGEKHGALTALYSTGKKENGSYIWVFRCDCGNEKEIPMNQVRHGSVKSCGCGINRKPSKPRSQRVSVGDRFGKLQVVELLGKGTDLHFLSRVKCDCGNVFIVRDTRLINRQAIRCRKCANGDRELHGMTNTRIFNTWQSMRDRCFNKNNAQFENYGGRGITICNEWKNDFLNFYEWAMQNGYESDLTIERVDVNGNYDPSNCKWATRIEQARNKQDTIYINYEGEKLQIGVIAEITGIKSETIYERIHNYHWDEYDATHLPVLRDKHLTRAMRKCVLTNKINGETIKFDSASTASRYLGKSSCFIAAKTYKLGNSFDYGNYRIDVDERSYKKRGMKCAKA